MFVNDKTLYCVEKTINTQWVSGNMKQINKQWCMVLFSRHISFLLSSPSSLHPSPASRPLSRSYPSPLLTQPDLDLEELRRDPRNGLPGVGREHGDVLPHDGGLDEVAAAAVGAELSLVDIHHLSRSLEVERHCGNEREVGNAAGRPREGWQDWRLRGREWEEVEALVEGALVRRSWV